VKPKNWNVSGRPRPRSRRCWAANRPKRNEARLLGVQLQAKDGQTLRQVSLEPLCVRAMLKPEHDVVGVPDDEHVTAGMPLPPLLGPQVEDVVQVDVCEQR
jgi:hypothetical protein